MGTPPEDVTFEYATPATADFIALREECDGDAPQSKTRKQPSQIHCAQYAVMRGRPLSEWGGSLGMVRSTFLSKTLSCALPIRVNRSEKQSLTCSWLRSHRCNPKLAALGFSQPKARKGFTAALGSRPVHRRPKGRA